MDHSWNYAFRETRCHFLGGLLFYRRKRNTKKGKLKNQLCKTKCPDTLLLFGGPGEGFFLLAEIRGVKIAILSWHMTSLAILGLLGVLRKPPKCYKNMGFTGLKSKPKWNSLFQRRAFGMGVEKGFHYLWCAKRCALVKHHFYSVFGKRQQLAEKRVKVAQHREFIENSGLCFKMRKGVCLVWVFCCMLGLGGWLCGVCVLLCVLFGTVANVLNMLVFQYLGFCSEGPHLT